MHLMGGLPSACGSVISCQCRMIMSLESYSSWAIENEGLNCVHFNHPKEQMNNA